MDDWRGSLVLEVRVDHVLGLLVAQLVAVLLVRHRRPIEVVLLFAFAAVFLLEHWRTTLATLTTHGPRTASTLTVLVAVLDRRLDGCCATAVFVDDVGLERLFLGRSRVGLNFWALSGRGSAVPAPVGPGTTAATAFV